MFFNISFEDDFYRNPQTKCLDLFSSLLFCLRLLSLCLVYLFLILLSILFTNTILRFLQFLPMIVIQLLPIQKFKHLGHGRHAALSGRSTSILIILEQNVYSFLFSCFRVCVKTDFQIQLVLFLFYFTKIEIIYSIDKYK